MSSVAVIDYGMGNLHSVAKAIEHVAEPGIKLSVSADEKTILAADRVVLPGVGAIRDCMAEIRRLGIDDMVRRIVEDKPLLGICVGMQALLEHSEENGGVDGIGLFSGSVKRFPDPLYDGDEHLKVPHMGWNNVRQSQAHSMWQGIEDGSRFYFVHSYYVEPAADVTVVGKSAYPAEFACALVRPNVFAAQFHPEKSQSNGLQLYRNFLNWNGES